MKQPHSILRNTTFNIAAASTNVVVGLLLSPILLKALGVELFGLWSLLWAITGALGLFDFRITLALAPFVAEAMAQEDRPRLSSILSTGLLFYVVLGILEIGAAIAFSASPILISLLPQKARAVGGEIFILTVSVFAINSACGVFSSFFQGLQRYDLTSCLSMIIAALRVISLSTVAWGGGGIVYLLLAEGGVALIQCIAFAHLLKSVEPSISFLKKIDYSLLRNLLAFGGRLQVAYLAFLVSFHGDKFMLSLMQGLHSVAYYELGSKIAYAMRSFPLLLVSATMPTVTFLEVAGEKEKLWKFYLYGTKLLVFTGLPLLIVTTTGSKAILLNWVNITQTQAVLAVIILSIGYFFNLVSGMANSVTMGIKKPEIEMSRGIMVTVVNITLSAFFIHLFGFIGAPLGTALSMALGTVYMIKKINSYFGRSLLEMIIAVRNPLVATLPTALLCMIIMETLDNGRIMELAGLVISSFVVGSVYLILGVKEGVFPLKRLFQLLRMKE